MQLAEWGVALTKLAGELNQHWLDGCELLHISPPGGGILVDRDELPAAIWIRLPEGIAPGAGMPLGSRPEASRRVAGIFARHPEAVRAAAWQFCRERIECRRAEAAGGGR